MEDVPLSLVNNATMDENKQVCLLSIETFLCGYEHYLRSKLDVGSADLILLKGYQGDFKCLMQRERYKNKKGDSVLTSEPDGDPYLPTRFGGILFHSSKKSDDGIAEYEKWKGEPNGYDCLIPKEFRFPTFFEQVLRDDFDTEVLSSFVKHLQSKAMTETDFTAQRKYEAEKKEKKGRGKDRKSRSQKQPESR